MAGIRKPDLRNIHPCFGTVKTKARMHLPICPACNIECAFCRRSLNDEEVRPGVASFILPVQQVGSYVDAALARCDELSVVGVAGPGDTLVGNNLFEAFETVKQEHPQLLRCISTNGLLLEDRADELIRLGIDTLTVTVNALDPKILSKIVLRLRWKGAYLDGPEAAELLIRNQIAGIRRMASAGTLIKVNTVLIPGLNDEHISEIARAVSEAGARLYNIIPLIPQHRMADLPVPTCEELESARQRAGKYIEVFRHCQHCRADAIGIPGISDYTAELAFGRTEEVFSHG